MVANKYGWSRVTRVSALLLWMTDRSKSAYCLLRRSPFPRLLWWMSIWWRIFFQFFVVFLIWWRKIWWASKLMEENLMDGGPKWWRTKWSVWSSHQFHPPIILILHQFGPPIRIFSINWGEQQKIFHQFGPQQNFCHHAMLTHCELLEEGRKSTVTLVLK